MTRKYQKKNVRAQWSPTNLRRAILAIVQGGQSQKQAAKSYNIPRETLRRHLKKAKDGQGVEKKLGRQPVLSMDEEDELVSLILDMEAKMFGLTPNDVCNLVYQYCELNKIEHPFNREREAAGRDWKEAFLRRHPELSVRIPEPTSAQRASGFNKPKVKLFFDQLEKLLFSEEGKRLIPEANIYNVDETGYTVCHKPQPVIALKGKKAVGQITSAEKGKNITVVCAVSATGHYIPPMFIFPRVRMKNELMDKAPFGSVGSTNITGWITEDIFGEWFEHFIKYVHPKSKAEPVLLILDGHTTHTKNVNVIQKARCNNVIIISLPSHCTHKMQPLDVAFFKSANDHYDKAVQKWLRLHPGRVVTEFQFAELFSNAYGKAATMSTALNGFRKCGISPFDPDVFGPKDFMPAGATDRPLQEEGMTAEDCLDTGQHAEECRLETCAEGTNTRDLCTELEVEDCGEGSSTTVLCENQVTTCQNKPGVPVTFSSIIEKESVPFDTLRRSKRKRKVAHATVLTDSPYLRGLAAAKFNKKSNDSNQTGKKKPVKKSVKKSEEDALCIYCHESYLVTGGRWIQCVNCYDWAHELCAGVDRYTTFYECEFCD